MHERLGQRPDRIPVERDVAGEEPVAEQEVVIDDVAAGPLDAS